MVSVSDITDMYLALIFVRFWNLSDSFPPTLPHKSSDLEQKSPKSKISADDPTLKKCSDIFSRNRGLSPNLGDFFELFTRIAAIQCLIDFIKIEKSNGIREFEYLLKIVKNDNESLIRYKTLRLLAKNPPFKKMESTLNTSEIRNLLWEIISQFSACDSNVRCAAIHLWKLLYR